MNEYLDIALEVGKVVGMVAIGFVCSYMGYKNSIFKYISDFITQAENEYINQEGKGKEKMAWVLAKIREKLPPAFRPLLKDEWIEDLVQTVFDCMKEFAAQQIEQIANRENKAIENKEENKK